jgi:hypothetical protein
MRKSGSPFNHKNNNIMAQGTSITAWHEKLKSISTDERAVLAEIRKGPGTINEIAKRMGWETGWVSARNKKV